MRKVVGLDILLQSTAVCVLDRYGQPVMRVLRLASVMALATIASPAAIQAAEQKTVVLQAPMWGCPTLYQAASWATRERCVMVKPPAIGRLLDGLSVQGNDYVKVAVDGGHALWFSAVPMGGPWQTWLVLAQGESPKRAAADAAAHVTQSSAPPEPADLNLNQSEVDRWKADGVNARLIPVPFKAVIATWVCQRIDNAREVEDAAEQVKTRNGVDAEAATRMLNDAVARGDCWLMDKGTEGLDLGVTTDDAFRNVWLNRFPYGEPVIMAPHASGIGGWAATENHPWRAAE